MTVAPHPRSFLAIACWIQEHFDFWDRQMRAPALPQLALPDASEDRFLTYYREVAAGRKDLSELIALRQLEKFVPDECISTDAGRLFVSEYAKALTALQTPRQRVTDLPSTVVGFEGWRPNRRTQVETIVGGFMSLSDHSRTLANLADFLNRGIPTGDDPVDDGHVRNALKTFARKYFHLIEGELFSAACLALAMRWRVLEEVWARAKDYVPSPHPISLSAVIQMRDTGLLEELRLHAELKAIAPISPMAEVDLINWRIRELKGPLRRSAA